MLKIQMSLILLLNLNTLKTMYILEQLWAEGPAFIPHLNTLVWSDIPNNRMH